MRIFSDEICNQLKTMGLVFEHDSYFVFFGQKTASIDVLQKLIPRNFCVLHQIHGDSLVEANPSETISADAQWTNNNENLLIVKSADCMPIVGVDTNQKILFAIHSGWRGVDQQILKKSLQKLNLIPSSTHLFVGPHIQSESFEVDLAVASQMMRSHRLPENLWQLPAHQLPLDFKIFLDKNSKSVHHVARKINQKIYLDLFLLTLWQLEQINFVPVSITNTNVDTKTSNLYYSYRRGEKGVRNYSFIAYK